MRIIEVLKVDSKGRVTIPRTVREALNIEGGDRVVMIADLDKGEITLLPSVSGDKKVIELVITFSDVKGVLAKIAEKLSELGVNQLSTNCKTIKKGEVAECQIIAEVSEDVDVEKALKEIPEVKEVMVSELPQPR